MSDVKTDETILGKLDDIFLISEIFASRKMAAMLALGASAGLPILLVYTVLSAWLRESGVSRSAIGFFVVVGFAYSLKFLWAPLVDRIKIPGFSELLGKRRGWTLFAILATGLSMFAMGFQDPTANLANVAVCASLIALSSATLDICVDAWRVDSARNEEQAAMSAVYQLGYRFGMIAAVSGGLLLADIGGFKLTYTGLAVLAMAGASTPLWAGEPDWLRDGYAPPKRSLQDIIGLAALGVATLLLIAAFLYFGMRDGGYLRALGGAVKNLFNVALSGLSPEGRKMLGLSFLIFVFLLPFLGVLYFLTAGKKSLAGEAIYTVPIIGDFADIVRRTGWMALIVFAIVATYRISDTTMGVMAMPLYIDLGYAKSVIGGVKGVFGISMLIVGAFAGGWGATKYGMGKAMIIGAILTIITNLAFAWLATVSTPKAIYLFVTIGADNIAAGFAGSVFIAFMSILTNKKFSASQYALFSSLFAFYGKSMAAFSGVLADKIDYMWFFIVTSGFGVPALIFVIFTWASGFTDSINEEGVPKSRL